MTPPNRNRIDELLADRALAGLSETEAQELESLLEGAEDSSFDEAAAAADLAMHGSTEGLPAHLAKKIEADALSAIAAGKGSRPVSFLRPTSRTSQPANDWVQFAGWIVAAACLAIAVASWLIPREPVALVAPPKEVSPTATVQPPVLPKEPVVRPSVATLREKLIAKADTLRVAWTTTKDPGARGASGDVVWNEAEQRGYMRFHGLATNDPAKSQYQLWIFDPSQDQKTPIDGGVFDIDPATGDTIVAITPKLHVTNPSLFAVTVEKPGGVVVSKREHIMVVAPVKV